MKISKPKCLKCGSIKAVKNGFVSGWQRYKCKNCGYQYTKQSPHGQPLVLHMIAFSLFLFGFTKKEIAEFVGISPTSVARWIKKYYLFHMVDVAPFETRKIVKTKDIASFFKDAKAKEILTITRTLPSGGRIDIFIHKPD